MEIKRDGSRPSAKGSADRFTGAATTTTAIAHIAMTEDLNRHFVEWMEKASDERSDR